MTLVEAIILLITGLIMGTVFVYGSLYWDAPIEREDAVELTATFDAFRIVKGRRHSTKEIRISFSDYDTLYIDGACASKEVVDGIRALIKGKAVTILKHPNSNKIWELWQEDRCVLSLETAQYRMKNERTAFIVLGLFMYMGAAVGGGGLLQQWLRKRKHA